MQDVKQKQKKVRQMQPVNYPSPIDSHVKNKDMFNGGARLFLIGIMHNLPQFKKGLKWTQVYSALYYDTYI